MDCKKLNEYLSNLAVLNAKLHNLHWNVKGIHFMEIHQFTETLYNDFFEKYDEVAELLKMRGEKPLVKLSDYVQNASIKELDENDFSSDEVIKIIQEDLNTMKNLATDIRNTVDKADDFEVVSMFEGHISGYSKNLWFIKSMLA